jgi:hypothetical protein
MPSLSHSQTASKSAGQSPKDVRHVRLAMEVESLQNLAPLPVWLASQILPTKGQHVEDHQRERDAVGRRPR